MRKVLILCAVLFVGASCKKSGGEAACADAINKAVDQMMGAMGKMAAMPDDAKAAMKAKGDELKGVIIHRCTEDKWSSEVLDCYAKAASMPDIRTCRGKLPPEQSAKLQAEEMKVMMAGAPMRPAASLDELQKKYDDLAKQIDQASQDVSAANDDASRSAAKERVVQLQRQQMVLKQQLEAAKAAATGGQPPAAPPAPPAAPAAPASP